MQEGTNRARGKIKGFRSRPGPIVTIPPLSSWLTRQVT